MSKYKKYEIEVTPHLLKKLLEYVKTPEVAVTDIPWIVDNLKELSKCDETLSLDEYELVIRKPVVM